GTAAALRGAGGGRRRFRGTRALSGAAASGRRGLLDGRREGELGALLRRTTATLRLRCGALGPRALRAATRGGRLGGRAPGRSLAPSGGSSLVAARAACPALAGLGAPACTGASPRPRFPPTL